MPARPRLLPAAAVVSAMLLVMLGLIDLASHHRTRLYAYGAGRSFYSVASGRGVASLSLWRESPLFWRTSPHVSKVSMRGWHSWTLPRGVPVTPAGQSQVLGFSCATRGSPQHRQWTVTFPLWAPMLPLAVPPALWWHHRRRATRPGFPVGRA